MARPPAEPRPPRRAGGRSSGGDGRRLAGDGSRAPGAGRPAPALGKARPEPGPGLVLLAEFGRAHGLSGEVRLKSFTADPLAVGGYGALVTDDGRALEFASLRPASGGAPDILVARVKGAAGREAAEALLHVRLFAPRDRLGDAAEDEFFAADLVGLAVHDRAGRVVGTVAGVPNFGGGDLLEIRPAAGPTALLPFTKAFVPEIDLAGRRVVIDPPDDLFAPSGPPPRE